MTRLFKCFSIVWKLFKLCLHGVLWSGWRWFAMVFVMRWPYHFNIFAIMAITRLKRTTTSFSADCKHVYKLFVEHQILVGFAHKKHLFNITRHLIQFNDLWICWTWTKPFYLNASNMSKPNMFWFSFAGALRNWTQVALVDFSSRECYTDMTDAYYNTHIHNETVKVLRFTKKQR